VIRKWSRYRWQARFREFASEQGDGQFHPIQVMDEESKK